MKRRVYRRRRRRNRKKLLELDEILQIAAILVLIPFFAFLLSSGSRNDERVSHLRSEKIKSAEGYINPVPSSDFGTLHWDGKTHAIDMFAKTGTPVIASSSGVVKKSGWGGFRSGIRVNILDVHGVRVFYGHLNAVNVERGQVVRQGQVIGWVGYTGSAKKNAPHLHFEFLNSSNKPGLPRPWLEWKKQRKT